MKTSRLAWTAALAVIGWALCLATIGIGQALTTMGTTLIVHAILAPLYFIGLSWLYFHRFPDAQPLTTAVAFTGTVVLLDFFLVALVILRDLAMFGSVLGTWIPFASIFAATYLTGLFATRAAGWRPAMR
jgi:hypothetical protein